MKSRFIYPMLVATSANLWIADAAAAACEPWVARLASFKGHVEGQSAGGAEWRAVEQGQSFCPGDKVRTLEHSRASLELSNQTYLSLDQKTTVAFILEKPQPPSWLDLLKGIIYLRSRTPKAFNIRAPFINAAIKGTEFLVSSDEEKSEVTVFEGQVEASNPKGSVNLTGGQTAIAQAGQAPARKILLRPQDAVQWALYYPPIIDIANLRRSTSDPAVRRAASHYLAGDTLGALEALDAAATPVPTLKAGLLLSLGRVEEAQELLKDVGREKRADALALQAIIALTKNDKAKAMELAREAMTLQPNSPTAWTALSYVQQAHFDLESALTSARKTAELSPDNGLAQTRMAELLASLGRLSDARKAATKAVQLNPALARPWAVLGFTQLTAMDTGQAMESFRNAIRIDSSDPLPRFGLGLAKIREGHLEKGTEEIEIAASLDPNDSLTRSYLGKAYYEQKRNKLAETEYHLAEQFDPKDPTPWFYDAIKKQTENRPVEALHNLQKAIELNDNRAVYRSRQFLDDDLAARSAAQGRVYTDLGFGQRALLEGWRSVTFDPANYSAHRFLADTYYSLRRNDIARTSELLQSQLLQPLNMTPLQPALAETNLLILQNTTPTAIPSYNEFNPLFARNQLALQTSGVLGNNGTAGDEVIQSGIWNKFSYSLGQFHYETDGFRPNNDLREDIYNAFGQWALSPDANMQIELRNREAEFGDLVQRFDGEFLPGKRTKFRRNTARFGLHYQLSPNQHLIGSYIYQNQDSGTRVRTETATPFGPFAIDLDFDKPLEAHSGELGYLLRDDFWGVMLGAGHYEHVSRLTTQTTTTSPFSGTTPESPTVQSLDTDHSNGFAYLRGHLGSLAATAGLSVDEFDRPDFRIHRVSPKLGAVWQVAPNTILRAAWFQTVKRPFAANQTIEPTQVAGFTQFFDDFDGAQTTRYGVGLDHELKQDLLMGGELSWRAVDFPFLCQSASSLGCEKVGTIVRQQEETQHRAYLYWAPFDTFILGVDYFFDKFQDPFTVNGFVLDNLTTHRVPLFARYFATNGFFAGITTTFVDQHLDYNNALATLRDAQRSESFWTVDASLGFRFPKRLGKVTLGVKNLFNEKFHIEDLNTQTSEPITPLFLPERVVFGQFTVQF